MSKPPQPPLDDSTADSDAKVAVSALDFLLIELVPLAQRVTERVQARERAWREDARRRNSLLSRHPASSKFTRPQAQGADETGGMPTTVDPASRRGEALEENGLTCLGFRSLTDRARDGVSARLDVQGYRVGQGLVERFSVNKPRPQSALDAVKFVCKDLWTAVWRKPIDNLKTNHRGVFVLTDARFTPLGKMSVDRRAGPRAGEESVKRATLYLYFPCGIIRGALSGLGIEATVEGGCTELPTATFQIKTKGAKP